MEIPEDLLLSLVCALNLSDDRVRLIFCGEELDCFSEFSFSPNTDTEFVKLTVLLMGLSSALLSFPSVSSAIGEKGPFEGDLLGELLTGLMFGSLLETFDRASFRE